MPIPDSSPSPKKSSDPKFLPSLEVDELLTTLEHSHGLYYKMMNLEVWAIVETLDQFFPGSWGHFMTNRKVAMKQFLQRQQAKNAEGKEEGSSDLSDLSQGEEGLADAIDNFVPPPLDEDGGATSSIPFPS
ncbi:hypothetical protein PN499_26865 [Kamptonema animale CS-326]|jgi:hypothetical protein|uniref:hypothetical protein n=1 Tax=Kamptonema animale TaxID=92934 RepID=UPI00232F6526|nr:hypothetical protein [Kamptonema animale]MDB9514829.1 hypothetical protein [Kamptonema animale CS-326]